MRTITKKMKQAAAVIVLGAVAWQAAYAGGTGTSGAQFLKIGVDANSAALGETGAVSSGSRSVFLNPAGINSVEGSEIGASQVMWIEQINYSNVHFAKKAFGGAIGAGLNYLTVPAITKVDNTGTALTETYAPNDMSLGFYYARPLGEDMAWGAGIKYISSRLDDVTATAIAVDGGLTKDFPGIRTQAGIAVKNLGTQMKFVSEGDPLPLTVKVGGKHKIPMKEAGAGLEQCINTLLDVNYVNDSGVSVNGGVEYCRGINADLNGAVRAGYKTSGTKGLSGAGASFGFGLGFKAWTLDYAYAPYGDLGNTSRVSLAYKF